MITVHHLNFSRSVRILWLMEELGLDYKLIRYERDAGFRAPPELKEVHPLGKAPVIEDGTLKMAESGPILDYINTRYGAGRLAPPPETDAAAIHQEWLHYAESSAALPIMTTLLGMMTGGLPAGLAGFMGAELAKTLDFISDGIGDGPFLMGELFTIADIQLAYLLTALKVTGALNDRPVLTAYLARLNERPALLKAIEIGGPMTPM